MPQYDELLEIKRKMRKRPGVVTEKIKKKKIKLKENPWDNLPDDLRPFIERPKK